MVSIIYVTWNRKDSLMRSIRSVTETAKNPDYELLVVDNASADGTVKMIEEMFPFVKIIQLDANYGPITARNIGAAKASGEILLFLDDDCFLRKDVIPSVIDKFNGDDKVAAVAAKVINAFSGAIESDFYPVINSAEWKKDIYVWSFHSEGAVAIKKEAFIAAGSYCEEYFRQGESLELSLRLNSLGYRIIYSPEIEIFHEASSLMRDRNRINSYEVRNTLWNDYLGENGLEMALVRGYHIAFYFWSAIKGKIPFPLYFKALYEGLFKIPKYRKVHLDDKTKKTINHIRTNVVQSKLEYDSIIPVGNNYIFSALKKRLLKAEK